MMILVCSYAAPMKKEMKKNQNFIYMVLSVKGKKREWSFW